MGLISLSSTHPTSHYGSLGFHPRSLATRTWDLSFAGSWPNKAVLSDIRIHLPHGSTTVAPSPGLLAESKQSAGSVWRWQELPANWMVPFFPECRAWVRSGGDVLPTFSLHKGYGESVSRLKNLVVFVPALNKYSAGRPCVCEIYRICKKRGEGGQGVSCNWTYGILMALVPLRKMTIL